MKTKLPNRLVRKHAQNQEQKQKLGLEIHNNHSQRDNRPWRNKAFDPECILLDHHY